MPSYTSLWGGKRNRPTTGRPTTGRSTPGAPAGPPRTGAATGDADTESGTDNAPLAEAQRQALFALRSMHQRGLIDDATFEARRAEIEAGQVTPED